MYQVLLAGNDISQYVDEGSLQFDDILGQGEGASGTSSIQGRSSTFQFECSLGPMNTAIGAGQVIPLTYIGRPLEATLLPLPPPLVRQGEIIIKNPSGTTVFGGYVTYLYDSTTTTQGNTNRANLGINTNHFTTVKGVDYTTHLDRILVNESYSAQTDAFILRDLFSKYAPWVNLSLIPTTGVYTFPVKVFRHVSLLKAAQTVAQTTGYVLWVDYIKVLHYVNPVLSATAPFGLSSNPDFITTFPHNVQDYETDDTSAINRVFFFGGRKLSNDFTQDLSPLANGNNKVFPLAYYPHPPSTGQYVVTVNGASKVVGFSTGSSASDTFKSQGGLADVLLNSDARNITFDVAPSSGATVLITYAYDFPLEIVTQDNNSVAFYGMYLDGYISDETVFDTAQAVQRCKSVLLQMSFGLTTLKVDTWTPGVLSGQTIRVYNKARNINGTFLVQEVQTEWFATGAFVYHLILGAWNWNLVDLITKIAGAAIPTDLSATEDSNVLQIQGISNSLTVSTSWSKSDTLHNYPYYSRSTPVSDGHDAYPGFATI